MRKYKGAEGTVEAIRWNGSNAPRIHRWSNGEIGESLTTGYLVMDLSLPTEERRTARLGDWIIRNSKGSFYPCNDLLFRKKYRRQAIVRRKFKANSTPTGTGERFTVSDSKDKIVGFMDRHGFAPLASMLFTAENLRELARMLDMMAAE